MFQKNTKQRRGFTLIELLIVIAIIALLAAILFPVFGRARENARRTSCANNLKQIGLGFIQYTQDYDERYPGAEMIVTGSNDRAWPSLLQPYIKSDQIFKCPSSPLTAVKTNLTSPANDYFSAVTGDGSSATYTLIDKLSYSRNHIQSNNWTTYSSTAGKTGFNKTGSGSGVPDEGLHAAAVEDASGTIHIFDAWASTNSGTTMQKIVEESRTDHDADDTASKVASRHLDGFNALFGDGHVKFRRWGSTTASEWSIQAD